MLGPCLLLPWLERDQPGLPWHVLCCGALAAGHSSTVWTPGPETPAGTLKPAPKGNLSSSGLTSQVFCHCDRG